MTTELSKHWSDCATNNAPALPVGPCDCGGFDPDQDWKPSEKMVEAVLEAINKGGLYYKEAIAIAVRPLIIAEERQRLFVTERRAMWKTDVDEYIKLAEAAERERVLKKVLEIIVHEHVFSTRRELVERITYLKDNQP